MNWWWYKHPLTIYCNQGKWKGFDFLLSNRKRDGANRAIRREREREQKKNDQRSDGIEMEMRNEEASRETLSPSLIHESADAHIFIGYIEIVPWWGTRGKDYFSNSRKRLTRNKSPHWRYESLLGHTGLEGRQIGWREKRCRREEEEKNGIWLELQVHRAGCGHR